MKHCSICEEPEQADIKYVTEEQTAGRKKQNKTPEEVSNHIF